MTTQDWRPPPQWTPPGPSRPLALLAAAVCVMWIAGLVAAALAIRRTVSMSRAIGSAAITALVVTGVAVAADFAWMTLTV